jgi:SnoaL-like protein
VAYAAPHAIGAGVILHVAIGHRWPFAFPQDSTGRAMKDLPEPVARALAAANANHTDAFLACFTPDGVVDDWGREFRGPDEIRGWSDREFIGKHVSLDVTGIEQRDDATTVTATVGGDGFNGPSHFTFAVDGDRLTRMTIRA